MSKPVKSADLRPLQTITVLATRVVPVGIQDWLRHELASRQFARIISRLPDRVMLTKTIFPALARTAAFASGSDVLWIGCRRFTKPYYRQIEARGARCWTLDIDPTVRRFGRRGRHVIGNVLELNLLFPKLRFDTVVCNGIFGFGVDTVDDRIKACAAMARVAKPGGWLLLGWNSDRGPDPLHAGLASPWFETATLPGFGTREVVKDSTHVYDVFRRRSNVTEI
jgi:SAM-dependent methyltransferase